MRRLMLLAVLLGAFLVGCESEIDQCSIDPDPCGGWMVVDYDNDHSQCADCEPVWEAWGPVSDDEVCCRDTMDADCLITHGDWQHGDGFIQAVRCDR